MDVLAIMDLAAELEERVALLYHNYSAHFHASQAGFLFWEHLSLEEKRHADMVRTYRHQRLLLPVCRRSHPDLLRDLEQVRRAALQELRQVEREHIREALEVAQAVENQLCRAHLSHISTVADPVLVRLLGRLGQEDQRHLEKIAVMARGLPG